MGSGLHKLREEDPTLHVRVDSSLHQTLLQGTGDLQVDVTIEKLQRRFGVHVELAKPRIPYRETIRRPVTKQGRHKKQTGGRGQFGDVHVRLEPLKSGSGFEFVDEIFGVLVADFSAAAVELLGKPSSTPAQGDLCLRMVRKPEHDQARYDRIWDEVLSLNGAYELAWEGAGGPA